MKSLFYLPLFWVSVLFLSPIHADISKEELVKRQCRSVHMNFSAIPSGSKAIYAEATAVKSSPGTYFCASNFNDGYMGFQEQANGKKVIIFSIWDPVAHGDNPNDVPEHERTKLIAKGENTRAGRFGNEGTGGQSFINYDWSIGEKMKFLVIWKPIGEKFKQISGYFYDNKAKKWQLISCWQTHSKKGEFSYSAAFVEDFRRNYDSAKQTREGAYGPVFAYTAENKWVLARKGLFTGDVTPSTNVKAHIDKQGVFHIATGGDITMTDDYKLFTAKELPETIKFSPPPAEVEKLITAPLLEEKK